MPPLSLSERALIFGLLCLPMACGVEASSDPEPVESGDPEPVATESGDAESGVSPLAAGQPGRPCDDAERVGSFRFYIGESRTIFSGVISDRIAPASVPEISASEGTCSLLTPRNLFCASICPSSQTCAGDDGCVDAPQNISAGKAKLSGALAEIETTPIAITQEYSSTVLDPFPAFVPGAAITLSLMGDDTEAFTLKGWGVAPMTTEVDVVAVASGSGVVLTWDPPEVAVDRSEVHINFSVNAHGAVTGWIECTSDDDGSFEVPESLVTQLVNMGLSGFPRATLGRRSIDRTTIASGCVDFEVSSEVTIDLEVDGLISCDDDLDCPDGQTCSAELACE